MKFFYGSVCLTNQKPRAFVSVRLLFLFCSRVFISRSYENRSNPTLKANHYDIIRLQLERNDELDDEGYARLPVAVQETSPRSSLLVEEQDRTREAGEPSLEEGYG